MVVYTGIPFFNVIRANKIQSIHTHQNRFVLSLVLYSVIISIFHSHVQVVTSK